jgi:hypothetical protein
MVIKGLEVGDSLPPFGSVVTITTSTPSMSGSSVLAGPLAVGHEQGLDRLDFAVALNPGLEHPVARQLLDVVEVEGAAAALADHLREAGDGGDAWGLLLTALTRATTCPDHSGPDWGEAKR